MGDDTGKAQPTWSPRRTVTLVTVWALAGLIVLPCLVGVGVWVYLVTPEDGDRRAQEISEGTAATIADEVVVPLHNSNGALRAEQIAEDAILKQPDPRLPDQRDANVVVELLDWNGATDDADGVRVDVRIEVRLLDLLSEASSDADEASVRAVLEDAFPRHTVATRRDGNELVASIMGPGHRDCLVGVRVGEGKPFRYTDFPRVQLEIGELGCSPLLYWSNVTAH